MSMKLRRVSERAREQPERLEAHSPEPAQGELDESKRDTAAKCNAHSIQGHPEDCGKARWVKPNTQWRKPGQRGQRVEVVDVGGDWDRRNDAECVLYEGKGCRMVGKASGWRLDSKRVETTALAEKRMSQHGRYKRKIRHLPRSPTALHNAQERPYDDGNDRAVETNAHQRNPG